MPSKTKRTARSRRSTKSKKSHTLKPCPKKWRRNSKTKRCRFAGSGRPSPKSPARLFTAGTKKKGNDTRTWKVKVTSTGKRWVPAKK